LQPILTVFNPGYYIKLLQQKWAEKQGYKCKMTQKEANALYEGPPFEVANRYAAITKTLFLTCFYAPAIPIAILYSAVGLTMTYWAEKVKELDQIVIV